MNSNVFEEVKAVLMKDFIFVYNQKEYRRIRKDSIIQLEAQQAYVLLTMTSGEQLLITTYLSSFLKQLSDPLILRVSRHLAINVRHLESVGVKKIELAGREVPINSAIRQSLLLIMPLIRTKEKNNNTGSFERTDSE
ncbi:LytTR family transcriptional regulator DNA-binding domain-containing protein [Siphonobacter sp. SORGH_AS_1065]|uniref:LytTR family transcriptional regulator DNA-binding domain-containing protein n=1 Tax=Siphonobacter sp. SORGH_AS_1065 TaxID=3041795 RepID=UPI002787362D|nr:LytTR family transcriptional regulator DNA-binding domain-containing protein [Siphonobacter sp. SORGH_AS_1065]MDQ1089780.1 DNA-binding LytR/AlgR family response regulator [Siphonobacter sp. SORGH_AS_1065]